MKRSNRATLSALCASTIALTAAALHPISSVYGTFVRTQNEFALSLDETAVEDLHVRPNLADPEQEVANWLSTCLRLHDRHGQPLDLTPSTEHGAPSVLCAQEPINYPLSISYTLVPSRILLPPTRLVFADAEHKGRAISLPNTGESQCLSDDNALPAILESEASIFFDKESHEFTLHIRVHILSLPAELLRTGTPIADGIIDENEAKRLAETIREHISSNDAAKSFDHLDVSLLLTNTDNEQQYPLNARLTHAEITQRWTTDELPLRLKMPLEALGQASLRVSLYCDNRKVIRGLVTLQDPEIVQSGQIVVIGRHQSK